MFLAHSLRDVLSLDWMSRRKKTTTNMYVKCFLEGLSRWNVERNAEKQKIERIFFSLWMGCWVLPRNLKQRSSSSFQEVRLNILPLSNILSCPNQPAPLPHAAVLTFRQFEQLFVFYSQLSKRLKSPFNPIFYLKKPCAHFFCTMSHSCEAKQTLGDEACDRWGWWACESVICLPEQLQARISQGASLCQHGTMTHLFMMAAYLEMYYLNVFILLRLNGLANVLN